MAHFLLKFLENIETALFTFSETLSKKLKCFVDFFFYIIAYIIPKKAFSKKGIKLATLKKKT